MAAYGGSIARRYARALFEVGLKDGSYLKLGQQLVELADVYGSSPELRQALENPVFKPAEKRAILERVLERVVGGGGEASRPLQRLSLMLLDRGRIGLLPLIARAYQTLADERAGQVRGKVTSATALSAADLDRVRRALEQRTRRKVILETAVDPDLIGGLVARVGDLVLDGSVRTQLDEMRRRLIN
jgi:F-type H+-transporting ATPase subunit delta